MHTWFSHRASLSPKWSTHDRRALNVSAAVWKWVDPVHTSICHGACLSPKWSRHAKRSRGSSAAVWEWLNPESFVYVVLPQGDAIP